MRDICSRSSQNQWRIGRRSFLKSFSAKGQRVSAKAISKPCLRHWKKSKRGEVICDQYCHVERSRNISSYSLGVISLSNVKRSFAVYSQFLAQVRFDLCRYHAVLLI